MNGRLLRVLALLAPLSLLTVMAMPATAQVPDAVQASVMRFGYGSAGPPISCPQSDQWLLAYWMGQPPKGTPVLSVHEMCPNVDRFWVSENGRWSGFSPALPTLANDPFNPPLGAAVFLHGERVVSIPTSDGDAVLPPSTGSSLPPVITGGAAPLPDTTRPTGATTSSPDALTDYALSLTRLLPTASQAMNALGELTRNPRPSDEQWRLDVRAADARMRSALAPFQTLNPPPCLETAHQLLLQTIESQTTYSLLMDSALDALDFGDTASALDSYGHALTGLQSGNALLIRATDALRASQCGDATAPGGTPPSAVAGTGTSPPARTPTATPTPPRATATPAAGASITVVQPDGSGCPASFPVKAVRQTGLYYVPGIGSYADTRADVCFANATDAQAAGYRTAPTS